MPPEGINWILENGFGFFEFPKYGIGNRVELLSDHIYHLMDFNYSKNDCFFRRQYNKDWYWVGIVQNRFTKYFGQLPIKWFGNVRQTLILENTYGM